MVSTDEVKALADQSRGFKEIDFRELSFREPKQREGGEIHSLKSLLGLPIEELDISKVWAFGNHSDGVVETAAKTSDYGTVEIGYYYGPTKLKNIIKVSSQIGCPARCNFCDLGDVNFKRNLTPQEIYEQAAAMSQIISHHYPEGLEKPHKINIAGSGEPLYNRNLVEAMELLGRHQFSFKVSTVFPEGKAIWSNFKRLAEFAGSYPGSIQIQLSIISTDEDHRAKVVGIPVGSIQKIREAAELWRSFHPVREQFNLNLILTEDTPVDIDQVKSELPPTHFRFRFRNYIDTQFGEEAGLETISERKMGEIKDQFRREGYTVKDDATPTQTEQQFSLASNVTRKRMEVH